VLIGIYLQETRNTAINVRTAILRAGCTAGLSHLVCFSTPTRIKWLKMTPTILFSGRGDGDQLIEGRI